MGGAGTGEKPGGPVSHKARKDAEKEEWMQYKADKNGKVTDTNSTESKSGLPAKINVEKGPPRNKKEEKAFEKAQKAGKEAIVRTSVLKASTKTTEKTKEFFHGDERIATVLMTKDIPVVKPTINGKPYDPANFDGVKGSKYTMIAESQSTGGSLVSGHNRKGYAEKVARSHVKAERDEWSKEAEIKLIKDHQKDNLVKDTILGRENQSVLTIRVLTDPKNMDTVEDLSMKTNGFNEELCRKRARVAALRDSVDAAPVTLVKSKLNLYRGIWAEENLVTSIGDPIGSTKQNFELLQEFLADKGAEPLKREDVYLHWVEAANGNFIPDRFMFLDSSTLRNVAARASDGFAFMNSHRTGGLSSPAELPYGKTFAGRYEEAEKDGILHRRALVGLYMLKGVKPNGEKGLSTDDLHKSILGGTISDVSMGLVGGARQCDVCVKELGSKDCPHVPATHKDLSPEQTEAQKSRGVSGGKASYTLVDAVPQEVSAVYKGAVPGAGFRKAMLYARQDAFRQTYGAELLSSYGALLEGREKLQFGTSKPRKEAKKMGILETLLGKYRDAGSPDPETVDLEAILTDDTGTAVPISASKLGSNGTGRADYQTQLAEERSQFLREKEAFEKQKAEHQLSAFKAEAETKLSPLVTDGKISVHQKEQLTQLYVFAAFDDAIRPVELSGQPVKRVDLLMKGLENLHSKGRLDTEEIGDEPTVNEDETVLANGLEGITDKDKPTASRLAALLATTELGKQGLADLKK
jgi:hypothetical protein